ncbi:phage portal protein family protein [Thermopirellula anaerolimosa]
MSDEAVWIAPGEPPRRLDLTQSGTESRLLPNLGQSAVPHVVTFAGVYGGGSKSYMSSDEALQHSWSNAQYLRQDVAVMEPLEVRKRAVALLDWHIEPDDPDDPEQAEAAEEVTYLLRRLPNFTQYRETLLEAVFYGRYAVVNRCRWFSRKGRQLIGVGHWRPLHGDKLVWRWIDDRGDFDPEEFGIRISLATPGEGASRYRAWAEANGGRILTTHLGPAFFPPEHLRELITIHRHTVEDGDYHAPQNAARVFGVGVRSRIYWSWYQKQEALAWLMEFLERSALGIELWYYPAGSERAKEDMVRAATERIGNARNVLIIPRPAGPEGGAYGVQLVHPDLSGAHTLKDIITEYFGHQIKRYILGQTLTTEAHATGLGSNLASIHLDTFLQIVQYDSINLAETLTTELVARIVKWNYPWFDECPSRLVIETEKPDVLERLQALQAAYGMGLPIRARDVRELLGLAEPAEDEEILSLNSGRDEQREAGIGTGEPVGTAEDPADPFSGLTGRSRGWTPD